jgi:aspartate kinase
MAAVDFARCRARIGVDGNGVLGGVAVQGGTGAEGGDQLSVVMKFGGSSLSSAARMEEVAGLILAFPEERPVVVLSAMGKTTNLLHLVRFFSDLQRASDFALQKKFLTHCFNAYRIFNHGEC